MKKLIITTFLACVYSFSAYAANVNVGISGQMGLFTATGKETHTDTTSSDSATFSNSDTEIGAAGYASVFIEGVIQDRVLIGVDYVPSPLETDTVETAKHDKTDSTTVTIVENKVQVDFEDLTTFYLGLMVTENAYIKAGLVSVDVVTNETLGTGSAYNNTSLDGTMYGVGYNFGADNGMFVRVEGNYMSFDAASLTSNDNKIHLRSLDGVTGKVSIGRSF